MFSIVFHELPKRTCTSTKIKTCNVDVGTKNLQANCDSNNKLVSAIVA